jgi:hypothetical protein
MNPALGEETVGRAPVVEEARPFPIVGFFRNRDALASVTKLDLFARTAIGARDEEHG